MLLLLLLVHALLLLVLSSLVFLVSTDVSSHATTYGCCCLQYKRHCCCHFCCPMTRLLPPLLSRITATSLSDFDPLQDGRYPVPEDGGMRDFTWARAPSTGRSVHNRVMRGLCEGDDIGQGRPRTSPSSGPPQDWPPQAPGGDRSSDGDAGWGCRSGDGSHWPGRTFESLGGMKNGPVSRPASRAGQKGRSGSRGRFSPGRSPSPTGGQKSPPNYLRPNARDAAVAFRSLTLFKNAPRVLGSVGVANRFTSSEAKLSCKGVSNWVGLMEAVTKALQLPWQARRLFATDGSEIDAIDQITDRMALYVSTGENFRGWPSVEQKAEQKAKMKKKQQADKIIAALPSEVKAESEASINGFSKPNEIPDPDGVQHEAPAISPSHSGGFFSGQPSPKSPQSPQSPGGRFFGGTPQQSEPSSPQSPGGGFFGGTPRQSEPSSPQSPGGGYFNG